MAKHRELYIKTSGNVSLPTVGKAIDQYLGNGWVRQPINEPDSALINADEWLYYSCSKAPGREPALVAITRGKQPDTFYVPNIVPAESSQLSIEQYNAILKDFHDTVLSKLSPDFTALLILGSDKIDVLTPSGRTHSPS